MKDLKTGGCWVKGEFELVLSQISLSLSEVDLLRHFFQLQVFDLFS